MSPICGEEQKRLERRTGLPLHVAVSLSWGTSWRNVSVVQTMPLHLQLILFPVIKYLNSITVHYSSNCYVRGEGLLAPPEGKL